MTEKQYENKIKKFLHDNGIYTAGTPKQRMDAPIKGWFFKVWGGGFQKAGIPDMICNINGYFVAIEVKAENGEPSKLQELNTQRINDGNGVGLIVYPKDFDKLKTLVRKLIND